VREETLDLKISYRSCEALSIPAASNIRLSPHQRQLLVSRFVLP
jgi:hypothetical protein